MYTYLFESMTMNCVQLQPSIEQLRKQNLSYLPFSFIDDPYLI